MPEVVIRLGHELHGTDEHGREIQGYDLHLPDPSRLEEFRQGYRCIACLGVQSVPFPAVCEQVWRASPGFPESRCGFEIRDRQMEVFNFKFEGYEDLWPNRKGLDDEREREQWEPRNGIWLPGDAA
jgi:hypothetical protein